MSDDFSELAELAADLSEAPPNATKNIRKALEVTGRNIKDDWRQGAEVGSGDGFSSAYSSSITYEMKLAGNAFEVEIGPELGRAGGSAGFLEDAPGGVRAAPQHAGRDALEANEDDFIRGLEIALLDAIEKG